MIIINKGLINKGGVVELILIIVTALLAISEILAYFPKVKENSIFQLIVSALNYFKGNSTKK